MAVDYVFGGCNFEKDVLPYLLPDEYKAAYRHGGLPVIPELHPDEFCLSLDVLRYCNWMVVRNPHFKNCHKVWYWFVRKYNLLLCKNGKEYTMKLIKLHHAIGKQRIKDYEAKLVVDKALKRKPKPLWELWAEGKEEVHVFGPWETWYKTQKPANGWVL